MAAVTSVGRASGLEPLALPLDSRAAEALYQRNAGRVFGYCLSRLRRREDAEDAVQTTFLYAVRSLRRGVVPLVESAWLLGIARNVCHERWETARRQGRIEAAWDPVVLDRANAAPQGQPDELIGLEEALTRLPAQQRLAVVLRDWRGLSYDEVAEQIGVSRAAVETLIFRGRRKLAEQLREDTQTTRRRLASLGNLGSLVTAVKTTFTGAAAATKIAAVVTVTAVGAGVAITSSVPGTIDTPSTREAATPLSASASASVRAKSSPVPAAPASAQPTRGRALPGTTATQAPAKTARPTRGRVTGTTAVTSSTTRPQAPANEAGAAQPKPVASVSSGSVVILPPAPKVASPVTEPVEKAGETLAPIAPVVETVTGSVTGVTETAVGVAAPVTAPVVGTVSNVVESSTPPVEPEAVVPEPPVALPPVLPLLP